MKGRHKPNSGHYYTANLCPNESIVEDSNHPDYDFLESPTDTPLLEDYCTNLIKVINSATQPEFEKDRKPTRISKPSILSGLHPGRSLPVQFTMECAIGDLGGSIRQPSNIYENLCQIVLQQSQLNAQQALYPEFDPDTNKSLPAFSEDVGHDYVFLRPRD
jgi:hypothetical protein